MQGTLWFGSKGGSIENLDTGRRREHGVHLFKTCSQHFTAGLRSSQRCSGLEVRSDERSGPISPMGDDQDHQRGL